MAVGGQITAIKGGCSSSSGGGSGRKDDEEKKKNDEKKIAMMINSPAATVDEEEEEEGEDMEGQAEPEIAFQAAEDIVLDEEIRKRMRESSQRAEANRKKTKYVPPTELPNKPTEGDSKKRSAPGGSGSGKGGKGRGRGPGGRRPRGSGRGRGRGRVRG